jgi:crotonobetainyl-CoA:carnitine CoA-transferase CaiB-like acyl-CoA transferase
MTTTEPGPLTGIRVIDFSQAMLGPAATMSLGDFGADVVKIERIGRGDLSRSSGQGAVDDAVFASMNRNKRSVAVDLRSPEGRDLVLELIRDADVVVSNFRPGVMERMGFGYDELAKDNPGLIWACGSGYGHRGPDAGKPGQDVLAQAVSGLMARRSEPDEALRVYPTCLADYTAAMHLLSGILLALLERGRTGRGQVVEVSLLDSMLAMQAQEAAAWLMSGAELNWGAMPLTAVFQTRDRPIVVVGAFRENPLRDICDALEIEDLSELDRFATLDAMKAHVGELRGLLAEAFSERPSELCLKELAARDILCAPVLQMHEALAGEQAASNEMVWRGDDGATVVVGSPVHLSRTPGAWRSAPPRLGADGESVLADFGIDSDRASGLRANGVIA